MRNIRSWFYGAVTVILLFAHSLHAGERVVQTGVASPQSESEEGNIEKLRERAIRNALDLAMLQVTGAVVSSERGDTLRSREDTIITDDKTTELTKQQSRFHGTLVSRTTGYARLVSIQKEWQDGDQYYVQAEVEVGQPEESTDKVKAGFFWERAGKPSIHLSLIEKLNGQDTGKAENKTLVYLRNNLVNNGIALSAAEEPADQYQIRVVQTFQTEQVPGYETYTSHCELFFQIEEQEQKRILTEYRAASGPSAGFTQEQSQEGCIRGIASDVSDKMIRKLAEIMNDRWNVGIEYRLSVADLPEENSIEASTLLKNLFRVSSNTGIAYQDNVLSMMMTYKGTGVDLAEAVRASFDELDWAVVPVLLEKNTVQLRWINQNVNN